MKLTRVLSVFLACMMVFSVITFAIAEEGQEAPASIDLTELFEETAELDMESETKALDIASLASKFLGFAVNNNLSAEGSDGLMSMVTGALSNLGGDTLANFKTNFLDNIVPAVSGLLSGDNSILSSLSNASGLLGGLLGGEGEGGGLLGGLLGGGSGSGDGSATEGGADVSSLLSAIGVNTDTNFSLSDITGIWENLKDTITGALQ
ncbi:MAG: hypothetical protein IJI38_01790 [Clostridia bacterium]|nr:hypothetical protein [Clostridia bacterium]